MDIRITVICENTVGPSLPILGEHGFAAYIETKKGNYLFDTGQGFSIINNAQCLKKDLSSIKGVFLSHGHYDHTGGLPSILKTNKNVKVYAHPDIFSRKYALKKTNGKDTQKYIGMKFKKEYYE
ncbi:MAG: MBL fold metallo-hydrolase, partial [Deltaproteobacteria bacterium]|nr:MBL fold metallo-hydrolase [Deltaproteobacteria bacterium]